MSEDDLRGWLIGVSVLAAFLGLGWYSSAADGSPNQTTNYSQEATDENGNSFENYQNRLDEYDTLVDDANDSISTLNGCADDVFISLDEGYYEDAYSRVQDCQADEVSNPGTYL